MRKFSEHQAIHLAAGERAVGVRRCRYDRLTPQIEGSVEHHRNASGLSEAFDQAVVSGLCSR